MVPVNIEIIAYAPTGFYHCTHCEIIFKEQGIGDRIHAEQLQSAMPAEMLQAYAQMSGWVNALVDRYGARVAIKVIDAASIEGVWKSMRYGVRRYPTAIIDRGEKFDLTDARAAEAAISQRVSSLSVSKH